MATRSSILAWEIPWTEEPRGLHQWGHKQLDMTATKQQQQQPVLLLACLSLYVAQFSQTDIRSVPIQFSNC